MSNIENFCGILRERSVEHQKSIQLLYSNHLYGQVISILRQELDSLIRVVYLLYHDDLTIRNHFVVKTLNNEKWRHPCTNAVITDRDMVNITEQLHGWTNSVYKLGCAFVHLSPLSDYKNSNPFDKISPEEQNNIKQHLHSYHNYPLSEPLTMNSVAPYLLKAFDKVSSNLSCYIDYLENNRIGSL